MNRYELLAHAAFLLVSTTSLFPWNLFMNAHQYFHYKLRNASESFNSSAMSDIESQTALQRSFEGWVTLTSGASCVLGSALNFVTTNKLSNTFRVISGHVTVLIALLPTVVLTFVPTDSEQVLFFWTSMLLASLASFGSLGLLGCGLLGLAARFPPKYVQSVMIGQSVAGILSSLLSIICQAFTSNAIHNGRLFFTISIIWTALSVFVYAYLVRSKNISALRSFSTSSLESTQRRPLLDGNDEDLNGDEQSDEISQDSRSVAEQSFKVKAGTVWKETRLEMIAGFVVLFGTLAGFPALSSLVVSSSVNKHWKDYFSAMACFLLFNVGDAVGRLISGAISLNGRSLVTWSVARLSLLLMLFFCNIQPRFHSSTIFYSDGIFVLIMSLFAISNGYLFTIATVSATRKVDADLRELTGSLMGLVAVVSSFFGSSFAVFLVFVV